jgi:hypothetical protein
VRLRFVAAMCVVSLAAMAHAMLTHAVFSSTQDPERAPDAERTRILSTGLLSTGLLESTRPGAIGGALFVLVLVAVGVYRTGREGLRLAAA